MNKFFGSSFLVVSLIFSSHVVMSFEGSAGGPLDDSKGGFVGGNKILGPSGVVDVSMQSIEPIKGIEAVGSIEGVAEKGLLEASIVDESPKEGLGGLTIEQLRLSDELTNKVVQAALPIFQLILPVINAAWEVAEVEGAMVARVGEQCPENSDAIIGLVGQLECIRMGQVLLEELQKQGVFGAAIQKAFELNKVTIEASIEAGKAELELKLSKEFARCGDRCRGVSPRQPNTEIVVAVMSAFSKGQLQEL